MRRWKLFTLAARRSKASMWIIRLMIASQFDENVTITLLVGIQDKLFTKMIIFLNEIG